jgi:hypothetical protein
LVVEVAVELVASLQRALQLLTEALVKQTLAAVAVALVERRRITLAAMVVLVL